MAQKLLDIIKRLYSMGMHKVNFNFYDSFQWKMTSNFDKSRISLFCSIVGNMSEVVLWTMQNMTKLGLDNLQYQNRKVSLMEEIKMSQAKNENQ